ncbi:hypothetical protein JDV02_004059 [Purpureocillium takamizusanense]|uniref:Heterokaryon incompatibility domain-containing protein n=1 Tax=Purpureocillium takamizusanense TaxID=2060973 RepID=A0A9Q8QFG7_9HYPO|nr:uncharacterized protein JDV02_004059 [Purpureocillium takamizusanense]UNI17737.1 hypothetical protein JDV02_004059 [Purpureocillium takamizusanense]
MLAIVRSLVRRRSRCGVCMFMLDQGAKSLELDFGGKPSCVFYKSDYHEFTHDDLHESAGRGCGHCKSIVRAFGVHQVEFTTARWWPPQDALGASTYLELDTNMKFELNISEEPGKDVLESVHSCIRPGAKLGGSTRDDACLAQAATWLESCRRDHDCCRAASTFRPTRLLSLDSSPGTVRLVESVLGDTVYAALSHRWTEETLRVRLERGNHAQRLEHGILIDDLPQMMRDVVFLLRRLGILYVWIDCLCIVQDNKDDWQREAAAMALIYTNAELTVAASWCSTGGQSLFSDRSGNDFAEVDIAHIDGDPVFLRRVLPHFTWQDIANDWFSGDSFIDAEREWPLLSRGWVYQEQLLSRRMLHVTRSELIWECTGHMDCECGWYRASGDGGIVRSQVKQPVTSKSWGTVVDEYSKRELTFGTDKLPALAGVAHAFDDSHGDLGRYCCGMWERDLQECFFWRSTTTRSRPSSHMPSWSWASVSGNVECWSLGSEMVQFKDVLVSYVGNPCMGDVQEARVILRGPLARATLHCRNGSYKIQVGDQWSAFDTDHRLDSADGLAVTHGMPAFCLVFGQGTSSSRAPGQDVLWEREYACFLVLLCVNESDHVYRRIGISAGNHNSEEVAELDAMLGVAETRVISMV